MGNTTPCCWRRHHVDVTCIRVGVLNTARSHWCQKCSPFSALLVGGCSAQYCQLIMSHWCQYCAPFLLLLVWGLQLSIPPADYVTLMSIALTFLTSFGMRLLCSILSADCVTLTSVVFTFLASADMKGCHAWYEQVSKWHHTDITCVHLSYLCWYEIAVVN
jgi:hypothetical protein